MTRVTANFARVSPRILFGGSEHTDTPALSFNGTAVARRNGFNSRRRVSVCDDSPPISFGGSECAVPSVNALVARREMQVQSLLESATARWRNSSRSRLSPPIPFEGSEGAVTSGRARKCCGSTPRNPRSVSSLVQIFAGSENAVPSRRRFNPGSSASWIAQW